ncbi:hypothetical protein TNCV_1236361 [Trichonephila clavipes]|nr:hypothetical protein TNCV_1236361 [Trichonephila clavipes]
MYGSTCADMQTTSGCFYQVESFGKLEEGRSVTSVAAEFRSAHSIVSMTLETISNYRNSYPGFSSGRPRGTHPQMTGTLSYRPEETGGRQREKSLDTRHRRLDDRYRVFTVARRLHGGGLFARRPVR